jgi:uncharacterized protein (DUF302 family)
MTAQPTSPPPALGFEVRLQEAFDAAVARVTGALKAEGFGIVTTLDVRATLQEKIGAEFRPYVILGACNPALAHRALSSEPEVGLLLPCNVTVEASPAGGCIVRLIDPAMMMGVGRLADSGVLRELATDARARFERVVQDLSRS